MIPMIPVMAIVGSLMVGIIVYAGHTMMEVQELQDLSNTNTQERLQESMFGEYEGAPTSLSQARIFSEWTDDSRIVGIMVTCDNGSVHTMEVDQIVHGGQGFELTSTMLAEMEVMAGRCP